MGRASAYAYLAMKQAVEDAGLRLDFQAPNPKTPSMTAALDAYLTEHNS